MECVEIAQRALGRALEYAVLSSGIVEMDLIIAEPAATQILVSVLGQYHHLLSQLPLKNPALRSSQSSLAYLLLL